MNRELYNDSHGYHFSESRYYYDYDKNLGGIRSCADEGALQTLTSKYNDSQRYYTIKELPLYENTDIQSPVDVNGFVKHRLNAIPRTNKQV